MDLAELRRRLGSLENRLGQIATNDPDAEIDATTLRVIDALVGAARELMPDDPVLRQADDLFSPEAVESGQQVYAAQVRLIVGMVRDALPQPKRAPRIPPVGL